MDRDYAGVIKKKLDDVYRTGGSGSTARSEKESRQAFIVSQFLYLPVIFLTYSFQILLNDMELSSSHMERLIRDLCSSATITQHYLDSERDDVKSSISAFSNSVPRFRSTLRVSSQFELRLILLSFGIGRDRTAIQPALAA